MPHDISKQLKQVQEFVRQGKFSFSHPRAPECFPLDSEKMDSEQYRFLYTELQHFGTPGANQSGFILQWGCKNIGFGEITFVQQHDGSWEVDSETMSQEFVHAALDHLCQSRGN